MKKYNLFLDDFRMPVDAFHYTKDIDFNILSWTIVRSYKEFVEYITQMYDVGMFPGLIAFDHDLADNHYEIQKDWTAFYNQEKDMEQYTGYHCAKWLVDFCMDKNIDCPDFKVHSMNPVGKENIIGLLTNFRKQWKKH